MEYGEVKKIVFITGTRADYGKLKALMHAVEEHGDFELHVFVTGMHMLAKYGSTYKEVIKDKFKYIYQYVNTRDNQSMDITLSNTIVGFSNYVEEFKPDLIVVHGDRVEALAGAIVGAINNVRVAHIEGGEISGTIDESIRHAVTKFAHFHLVANEQAVRHVVQLGERMESIFVIGSPDIDVMQANSLPSIHKTKDRYTIPFNRYNILMFHPVTTEIDTLKSQIEQVVEAVIAIKQNFVVIYPNNDEGSRFIFDAYEKLEGKENFKLFPSIRFEHFLTLLKHADCIIGNSSAGIREAGVYATPTVDIGNRQKGRYTLIQLPHIVHAQPEKNEILIAINEAQKKQITPQSLFGDGNSVDKFITVLENNNFWNQSIQKQFIPI